jgi:DNA modification methylase
MKPYYESGGITLFLGDCREILPTMPSFDLLLTDPPYGIGVSSRTFGKGRINGSGFKNARGANFQPKEFEKSDWDDAPADPDLIEMCRAKAKEQCIWGGNYFQLPPSMRWLVWDKVNDGTDFADCELAWTNQDKAVRQFRYRWNGMLQEYAGRLKEERLHPTMKPLALMKWCLSLFPEAKTVLDPFCGSGTTLVAAKAFGLKSTGIELHESYAEICAKRLSQEVFNFDEVTA